MKRVCASTAAVLSLGLAALLLAGCSGGQKKVTVNGKLTEGGKPLTLTRGSVEIIFIPESASKDQLTTYPAVYNREDGTFSANEVPTGTYKVTVRVLDTPQSPDRLKGKYDAQRSKIVKEVNGKDPVEIDLASP